MLLSVRPHYPLQLPPLPQIPIDLNQGEREFLTSLDGKIDNILVAGRERNKLCVLGNRGGVLSFNSYNSIDSFDVRDYVTIDRKIDTGQIEVSSFPGPDYKTWKDGAKVLATACLYIAYLEFFSATQRGKRSLQRAFHSQAMSYKEQNFADIEEKIRLIRLYQGTLEEVERDISKPLERVDTGKPETYLQENNTFWLRVEAYLLGANAVVHYQPGSAIGTPVRFKE